MLSGFDPDQLLGHVLESKYRLEEHIASGAMGSVFRARHVELSRSYAIKVLQKHGNASKYGDDIGGDEETIVSNEFDRPVMVHRYPAAIKAFYMQPDAERPVPVADRQVEHSVLAEMQEPAVVNTRRGVDPFEQDLLAESGVGDVGIGLARFKPAEIFLGAVDDRSDANRCGSERYGLLERSGAKSRISIQPSLA